MYDQGYNTFDIFCHIWDLHGSKVWLYAVCTIAPFAISQKEGVATGSLRKECGELVPEFSSDITVTSSDVVNANYKVLKEYTTSKKKHQKLLNSIE